MISSPDRPDGSSSRRNGIIYAFDAEHDRVVAFNKADGEYIEQYRLAGGDDAWAGLRGMVVLPAADAEAPSTMWWISDTGLHSALLEAVPDELPTPSPDASPTTDPENTPKPTTTPKA
jgi:hypothetical protein